jgi:hypothetical protein
MKIAINYFSTFFLGSYNLLLTAFGRCFGGMDWHNKRVATTITFGAVVFGPDWPRQVYNEKVRDLLVPMNSSLVQRSGGTGTGHGSLPAIRGLVMACRCPKSQRCLVMEWS